VLDEPSSAAGGTAIWRRAGVRLRSNTPVAGRPHSRRTRVHSSSGISLPPQVGRGQRAGIRRSPCAAITMTVNDRPPAAKTLKQTFDAAQEGQSVSAWRAAADRAW
jgi:hypothetical protein